MWNARILYGAINNNTNCDLFLLQSYCYAFLRCYVYPFLANAYTAAIFTFKMAAITQGVENQFMPIKLKKHAILFSISVTNNNNNFI